MTDIFKGVAAGVVATAVASVLALAKGILGVLTELNVITMLTVMVGAEGNLALGWVLHFVVGAGLFGAAFAWLEPRIPGDSHLRRGILFGVIIWFVMMVVLMPLADAGLFGLQIHVLAPIVTLTVHVIYGAVLGWVYGKLAPAHDPVASRDHHSAA